MASERPETPAVERAVAAFLELGRPHDALLVQLAAYIGLRHGEIRALEARDVDLDARAIRIERQVDAEGQATRRGVARAADGRIVGWRTDFGYASPPKSGRARTVPIPAHLHAALAGAIKRSETGLLVPSNAGRYRTSLTNWSQSYWDPVRDAAGWPRDLEGRHIWGVHSLRHHAATWMLDQLHLPVQDVAAVLGHASPEITWQRYVTPDADVVGRVAAARESWSPPPA